MKIVFTGGGTAGHIFPIIAIVRELKKLRSNKKIELFYFGPPDPYSQKLLTQENIKIKRIVAGKMRRYFSFQNIIDVFKVPIGIFQSFTSLFFLAPDLVFSKGGYGSFPVVISARLLHIPIFLHESDIVPGLASKIESHWALEIFVSFQETEFFKKKKMIVVGNPIRKELLQGSLEAAKKIFSLQGGKPLILILGGSQGSQRINDVLIEILPEMLENFEIIHITGRKNFKQVQLTSQIILDPQKRKYYHPFPFLEELNFRDALAASVLVISRGGSGVLFEIAASGKPNIVIPLSSAAQSHQVKNAYAFSKHGASLVIEESNLRPHLLLQTLKTLFQNPGEIEKMSKLAKDFSRPKAAKIIANYILDYLS